MSDNKDSGPAWTLDRHRILMESSPDGICICSLDGHILEVNEVFSRLTGTSPDELAGMRLHQLDDSLGGLEWAGHLARIPKERSVTLASRIRGKDGAAIPVEMTITRSPGEDGRAFIFARDIRSRLRSETLLRVRLQLSLLSLHAEVAEVMKAALDEAESYTGSTIGFYHFVDEDEVNLTLTAWSTRTLSGMCTAEGQGSHYPISKAGVWVDAFHARKAVIHNDVARLPHRKGMPEGHAPVLREVVVPVLRNERVVAILGVGNKADDYTDEDASFVVDLASAVYDIVERKRAEEALAESDRRFRHIVENAREGIWSIGSDGNTVFANPAMCRILERRPEDLLGHPLEEFLPPGELAGHQQEKIRRRQGLDGNYERRLLRADGSVRVCLVSSTALTGPDGSFAGSFGLFTDITDMRRAEEALRHSELLLNQSQRLSRSGGWEFNVPANRMTWTRETCRIHGLDPDTLVETVDHLIETSIHCYPLAVQGAVMEAFQRCCSDGVPYDMEVPFVDIQGHHKWVRTMGEAVLENGAVVRVTGTLVDVTERRTAEENYQALFRQLPDGFTLHEVVPGENGGDPDLRVVALNPAMQSLFGLVESRSVGRLLTDLHPALDVESLAKLHAVAEGGRPVSFTCGSSWPGRQFAVTAYRPSSGQVAAIYTDITDRRIAEEALQRRMGLLALMAELSSRFLATRPADLDKVIQDSLASLGTQTGADRAFIVLRSASTGTWDLHQEWERLADVARLALPTSLPESDIPWWLDTLRAQGVLHIPDVAHLPEEAVKERKVLAASGVRSCLALPLGSGGMVGGFIAFESLLASRHWSQEDQHVLRTAAGLLGSALERRSIDNALESSESRFRNLVETANDWVWEVDDQGCYSYVSPKCRDLLGYDPVDLLGRTPFDLMPVDEAARVRSLFTRVVQARRPFSGLINAVLHRTGRRVVMETSGSPVLDADGRLRGYRGVDRDVTARVQAERRMQAQADVSTVLAEAVSLDEATRRIVEVLCQSEGWEFGALWTLDPLGQRLLCSGHSHAPALQASALVASSLAVAFRLGQGMPGRVWESRSALFVPDVGEDPNYIRAPQALEAGLRSALGLPILHAGHLVGVLEFAMSDPGSMDDGLLDSLGAVGRQLGQFIVRRRLQEELQRVVAHGPAVIYSLRPAGERWVHTWVSDNIFAMTGYWPDEIDSSWWRAHVHPDDLPHMLRAERQNADQDHVTLTFRLRHRAGHHIWVQDERRLIRDERGTGVEVVGSWSDITERVRLEEQLRQSQKMEAVGQLAGGVAHDFNNLLTVINGYSEMLQAGLDPGDPNHGLLADVRDAGERAAALTRQLLAFSRRQVLEPRVVELGQVVRGLEKMLRRLIGEDISLATSLPTVLPKVCVDPGQLEQVVMNLAVNARDAMPDGGRLSIELRAVALDDSIRERIPDGRAGRFLQLAVTDTGCGMDSDTLTRIFEPFFTTKEQGKGTGLGLSTVFGIVQQSHGFMEVASRVGEGTTFRIYLPVAELPDPDSAEDRPVGPVGGKERILLVEDDPMVREVTRRILIGVGYEVIPAAGPEAALELAASGVAEFDLLLTDVVMPGINGPELSKRLRELRPGTPVLFMSGYTDDALSRINLAVSDISLLQKPFSAVDLTRRVREVLDGD
jgi:PAS domain S-box-containing protein